MSNKLKQTLLLILISCFYVSVFSCKKEKAKPINPINNTSTPIATNKTTDQNLFEMALDTTAIYWFNNSKMILPKSSGTGHTAPYLRTRYNSIAAKYLDSHGKILSGSLFPEGSLIVKELCTDSATIERYAILYKMPSSPDADAKGWIWGYIYPDGTVAYPAAYKGGSCIGCHSQTDNIDYMLMNKYFP